jgi:hypothetical protein
LIGVAFDGELELGDELTVCPKTASAKKSNVIRNMVPTCGGWL